MAQDEVLEILLQATSDRSVEWQSIKNINIDITKSQFYNSQHRNLDETVYCIFNDQTYVLVCYQLFDFIRKSIVSQFSLLDLHSNGDEELISDNQMKLNELKSLIFLNSIT
ncbi:hypothetical protein [Enterococcus wangshanyuanii]|uniref:Uncharacterized protein n=1 Tax=Enterococcus wangshanyuanii TaxID=2005703 RepID=A0ABQ1NID0_9ENTE|nr:hypothetical protein [Enterococcus wangshanyuanii]GGC75076.1 hypothetical protein GCM10011573_00770 [Enterococcus wangshanyuanii]